MIVLYHKSYKYASLPPMTRPGRRGKNMFPGRPGNIAGT